jgi:hypothetical protein
MPPDAKQFANCRFPELSFLHYSHGRVHLSTLEYFGPYLAMVNNTKEKKMLNKLLCYSFATLVFGSVFLARTYGLLNGSVSASRSALSHSPRFVKALNLAQQSAAADQLTQLISTDAVIKIPGGETVSHFTTLTPAPDGFYVLDWSRQQILRFDGRGRPKGIFGKRGVGPGAYAWPSGLAPVRGAQDPAQPDFWVSDFKQGRLNRLGSDGHYRSSFPTGAQRFAAKSVIQNSESGDIYLCGNSGNHGRVSVLHTYDQDGHYVGSNYDLPERYAALNLDSANDCLFANAGDSTLVAFPYEYAVHVVTRGGVAELLRNSGGGFREPTTPLIFTGKTEADNLRAFDDWALKSTLINNVVAVDDRTLLVQYETFAPLRYTLDVWDLPSKRLKRSIHTNHRLLAASEGRVFFLEQLEQSEQPEYSVIKGTMIK